MRFISFDIVLIILQHVSKCRVLNFGLLLYNDLLTTNKGLSEVIQDYSTTQILISPLTVQIYLSATLSSGTHVRATKSTTVDISVWAINVPTSPCAGR